MTEKCEQNVDGSTVGFFNMDAVSFLSGVASNSVDLVLIDPPYEISRDTDFKTGGNAVRLRISMDFGEWDKGFTAMPEVVKEIKRVLVPGGTAIIFYDLWKIGELKALIDGVGLKQVRFLEWLKTNPVPINSKLNYLTNSREIAVSCVKGGKPVFKSEYDNGVYRHAICRDKGRFHPTQKPLAFMVELIEKHSNRGGVVLDCFSGSGTTAVACLKTGRNFIGCELDEGYFPKAKERIEGTIIEINEGKDGD